MQMWKKVAIGAVSALTIAGGANLAAMAAGSGDSPAAVDVKGPCDEAEHANDARCAVPQVLEDRSPDRQQGDVQGREQERRGRDAENEAEDQNQNQAEDQNENEADDQNENEAEHEAEDNGSRGSDDSGRDDGAEHDRGDDHGDDRGDD